MNVIKLTKLTLFFIATLFILSGCKKPAGPGGKASIKGKIYVKDFNTAAYGPPISEYYGAGETVYICYGTNTSVGNTVKTSTDGSFEFLYLRKGHYKIFALSRDTSIHVSGSNKTIPVEVSIDIKSIKETITVPDITINN
ncbi:MAG: hypothetical protein ACXVPN_05085 [Bacteroidia bacterium]